MSLPKFEDRVVMHCSEFCREGTVYWAELRILRSVDQCLLQLPVYIPAAWETAGTNYAWQKLQASVKFAWQMYMSTTRGLPAYRPSIQTKLIATSSGYQLWRISVDGIRVALYERNPQLFEQEFNVEVTQEGERLGLTGYRTTRYYPEDLIAEQLRGLTT